MATGLYPSSNNRMNTGDNYSTQSHPQSKSEDSAGSVGFHMPCPGVYQVEDRKKYLTAKYGSHQMKLIRKRLAVEDWLDTELRKLYNASQDDTYDCTIDLDEVLDLEDEKERWLFVQEQVANCNQSQEVVNKFIEEVLQKAETL